MKKYLLDTNICIYIIKNKPRKVLDKFRKLMPEQVYISSITLAELEFGVFKSEYSLQNQMALTKFLAPIGILAFDDESAVCYGEIRSNLEKIGRRIGAMDLLIAAHALAEGMILVTNNEREFGRIHELEIENWVI